MKNTPTSIITALVSGVSQPYLLLDMEFTSGTLRLTNLAFDVQVGGNTYISDGGLTKMDPPRLTSVLDREVYRIQLIDFDNEIKSYFDSQALGTSVTVRLGIEGNYTELDTVFKGRIDGVSVETNPEEGTKEATIECTSPFAALDRTNNRMTDKQHQTAILTSDRCFDLIYASSKTIESKWGKK